uniref:Uncharacterized protein n=1 Tax=Megaselia scalaris TaxID=36166 RepID=T1GRY2_MEGSC
MKFILSIPSMFFSSSKQLMSFFNNFLRLSDKPGHANQKCSGNDALKIVLKKELDIPTVDVQDETAYLDGGDILFTGREFFVGLTERTNEGGAVAIAEAFPEYPCVPIKVSGDKCLKYYISMAGPSLLAVSGSEYSQDILKRIERVASFSYQTLTLDEEFAANMLYINGHLIHRSPLEIPESHRIIKSKIDTPSRNVDISEISRFSRA